MLLETALKYLSDGFSVIPVRPDKKPFIKWEDYQKRKPTVDEIKEWWTRWPEANIAIVTGTISGVVVIDVDKPNEGMKAVSEYLQTSKVPTAMTPRGGYHLYFKAPEKPIPNNARLLSGCDFRGEGGYIIAPPSKNGTGKAYHWLPGLSLEEVEPSPLPDSYISFINSLAFGGYGGKEVTDFNRLQMTSTDFKMFEDGRRDNDLFHTANCLTKGGMADNEISQILERLIISWGEKPDKKWIDAKIQSALKRADRRERNISEEIRDFVLTSSGFFLTSDCFNRLQVTSREEKKAVILALLRLKKENVIERHGEKNGCYRRIENQCEEIDFLNPSCQAIDIKYPLGIERYIITLPKNVMVIAGSKDAGKTAYLLNLVRLNMNRFSIHYFSSEMGRIELRRRLEKFNLPLESWIFKAGEKSSNFADAIRPDDINVIDYLEVSEDFYRVGGMLTEIYRKLNQGIAIVALQKNKGRDTGVGGDRSLEKPRLYLSLESGKAKIIVGKNWVSDVNPVGLQLDFKLTQGCKFIIQKDWYKG